VVKSLRGLARREGVDSSYVSRLYNLTTPASAIVAAVLNETFRNRIGEKEPDGHCFLYSWRLLEERLRLCAQFLMQSQHFKETPQHKLSAGMFATAKAMVKDGAYTNKERALQRLSGFFFDVSHISTYAPYCDAFVMDQPMADLVAKPTVALERRYGTKVFSLNNWDEFLAWLDSLEAGMGDEHKAALATAYPPRQILTTEPTETGSDAGD
jgi:hypothetical protein